MMAELKPCPFCGGKAEISLYLGNYGVACCECPGAVINCRYQTKEEAIKAWNRRTSHASD